jgi:hypothetical protein
VCSERCYGEISVEGLYDSNHAAQSEITEWRGREENNFLSYMPTITSLW